MKDVIEKFQFALLICYYYFLKSGTEFHNKKL